MWRLCRSGTPHLICTTSCASFFTHLDDVCACTKAFLNHPRYPAGLAAGDSRGAQSDNLDCRVPFEGHFRALLQWCVASLVVLFLGPL